MRYRLLLVLSMALGIGVLVIVSLGGARVQAGNSRPTPASGQRNGGLRSAQPRTILQVRGRIGAFAQDGDRIAWLWPAGRCDQLVQVRTLSTGVQQGLASKHGPTCKQNEYVPSLALAGTRALWTLIWKSNTEDHFQMVTGALGNHRDTIVGELSSGGGREGPSEQRSIPMAGDGSTLVYADVDGGVEATPDRGVRRVAGQRSTRIPGAIGAFAISASGRRLAILSDTNRTSNQCVCNSSAAWSPLGDRIAFSGQPEGDSRFSAIEVAAADGTNARKITNQTLGEYRADFAPDWSPDGSRLAFARAHASTNFGRQTVWTMKADGTNQRELTKGTFPAWSPDGTKIAFARDAGGISVINTDGSGLRQLTSGPQEYAPDWSPDGTKIVFAAFENDYEIRVMNADGTNVHDVAAGLEPAWSPDGNRIAFVRYVHTPTQTREVRVMNADGGNDHHVAGGFQPSWSPDGTRLAITKDVLPYDISLVRDDGSAETRLTTAKLEPIAPTLQLRDARSGRLIARVVYQGRGQAVALSSTLAAVFARDDTGTHVAMYDARNGSAIGIVPVRAGATSLSISGARIVFRSGKKIWLLDAMKRHVSLLVTAATVPISLSIDGRRVAWAENLRGHARIRALNVR